VPYLLSLLAALTWGAGDFFGGLSARRASALATAFLVQLAGLVLLLTFVPWTAEHGPDRATLIWGAFAGLSGGLSALTLYPALAQGNACEVAPLSAVIGTALPVLFGITQGERPGASAWIGIALAALTVVFVSADGRFATSDPRARRRSLELAALSGVFIGGFLIAFERAGTGQGFLPLLVARATSVPLFALALLARHGRLWPARVSPLFALAAGAFDMAANGCYLFALPRAPISLVATLSNLYPAFTVLLGVAVLRDRPRPLQQLGLVLALGAIVLITR
jgi:uncharacterized membrane protein